PRSSIDNIKPLINVPIMVLHECEITNNTTIYNEEYCNKIKEMYSDKINSYFYKQYNKLKDLHLYDNIKFHLILFPVPNKEQIIKKFVKAVEFYKDEALD
ncbi:Hachiman antiphage defense system protein HamA, partial [Acinetobacter oleivorans]